MVGDSGARKPEKERFGLRAIILGQEHPQFGKMRLQPDLEPAPFFRILLAYDLKRAASIPESNDILHRRNICILEVAFAPDGTLFADAEGTRFRRRPPPTPARVKTVLRELESFTGVSRSYGKTLTLDLVELSHRKVPK